MNILLNPLQCKSLIKKSCVGNASLSCEFGTAKESKGTEAVVESHIDEIMIALPQKACRRATVKPSLGASVVSTAVDPNKNLFGSSLLARASLTMIVVHKS